MPMTDVAVTSPRFRWVQDFRSLSQPTQFALAGGFIMLSAMLLVGLVISGVAARTIIDSRATNSALFLDSILSPLVQELAQQETLSPMSIARLDSALKHSTLAERFSHVDIWRRDGLLAYSTSPDMIGGRFPPPEGTVRAFEGEVSSRYTDLTADEHIARAWTTKYLEIYAPLREHRSGRIIAVVEVHELAQRLKSRLSMVATQTWLAVSGATLLIALALIGVVYGSSRLIGEQQVALRNRIAEIERVSNQNRELRRKVQRASGRLAEMNERYLRHVAAELHDGPIQIVGLSALKVEQARRAGDAEGREAVLQSIETLLGDASRDMRVIAHGLMLPEIEGLSLSEIIARVTRMHEQRTGTTVSVACEEIRHGASQALRICVYRFVQEGLNNAYRHAAARGQAVECRLDRDMLVVRVSDEGGVVAGRGGKSDGSLGLAGLRERVESLGGTFSVSRLRHGTTIEMSVALGEGDEA